MLKLNLLSLKKYKLLIVNIFLTPYPNDHKIFYFNFRMNIY